MSSNPCYCMDYCIEITVPRVAAWPQCQTSVFVGMGCGLSWTLDPLCDAQRRWGAVRWLVALHKYLLYLTVPNLVTYNLLRRENNSVISITVWSRLETLEACPLNERHISLYRLLFVTWLSTSDKYFVKQCQEEFKKLRSVVHERRRACSYANLRV